MNLLNAFIKNEDGQGMIEYGLIISLISIISIVALSFTGQKTKNLFKFPEVVEEIPTNDAGEELPPQSGGNDDWIRRWLRRLFGRR